MQRAVAKRRDALKRGFTLAELLLVMLIAAILCGIGVPAFGGLLRGHRLSTTANELLAAIHLARSEAIQRGARVDLVPASRNDWTEGWIILIDSNLDHSVNSTEKIILSAGKVATGITIQAAFSGSSVQFLAFNSSGHTEPMRSGSLLFTLGEHQRKLIINFQGRPRVCNPQIDPTNC